MTTLSKLQKQIEVLQAQAARLRKAEASTVIASLRKKIEEYSLTPEDLFGQVSSKPRKATTKAASPVKRSKRVGAGVPKFRDPKTGKTWTGFGKPPAWLAGKRDRTKFLIANTGADASVQSGGSGDSSPTDAPIPAPAPTTAATDAAAKKSPKPKAARKVAPRATAKKLVSARKTAKKATSSSSDNAGEARQATAAG